MRALLFLGLLGLGSQSFAADQFDLACSGTVTGVGQTTRHYRVDLKAGKWCANGDDDKCVAKPIAEVAPDLIRFERRDPQYPGDTKIIHYVVRTTGHWYERWDVMETEGTCEPAPFSGFPETQTKF
jgi:hypothetical protein